MAFAYTRRTAGGGKPAARIMGEEAPLKKKTLPNSTVMRMMQDKAAEQEADRLSQGITSATPDALREEMGGRLGADFSSIRFHSDSVSADRGSSMGARAWAQGSDVYFGRGGFSPSVAAHELVHTVQQGAVSGDVSRSMPLGTVQMLPEEGEEDQNRQLKQNSSDPAVVQQMILQNFETNTERKFIRISKKNSKR